jgi:hypothetical protein
MDPGIAHVSREIATFAAKWQEETPPRIHQRTLGEDGTPLWDGEFFSWMTRGSWFRHYDEAPSSDRLRLTRAMRNLRRIAPREYDVLRRAFTGETAQQICDWLNERAIRGGHPERYSLKDTVVLMASGLDKVSHWY